MYLGRVEFASGAHGTVTGIAIRSGRIEFTIDVDRPHPRTNVQHWKLYGEDETLIAMTVESEARAEWLAALPRDGGRSTVTLPLAVSGPWDEAEAIGPGDVLRGRR